MPLPKHSLMRRAYGPVPLVLGAEPLQSFSTMVSHTASLGPPEPGSDLVSHRKKEALSSEPQTEGARVRETPCSLVQRNSKS
jgi:hypothetical protein